MYCTVLSTSEHAPFVLPTETRRQAGPNLKPNLDSLALCYPLYFSEDPKECPLLPSG